MLKQMQNEDFFKIINGCLKTLGSDDLSVDQFKMVINAMNSSYRFYHNNYHLQEMTLIPEHHEAELRKLDVKNFDKFISYIKIAGFFHDIIYLQTDGSVDASFEYILLKNFSCGNGKWSVKPNQDDVILDICVKIFDIKEGDLIPSAKVNELLSAFIAGKMLQKINVDDNIIAKIIICIESTIPFRTQENFDARIDRIKNIVDDEEIDEVMYASVYLANKDCYNFSGYDNDSVSERLIKFLQNTWRLSMENIPDVKDKPIYACYFLELVRSNIKFFNMMLDNDKYKYIFHHHKDYPTRFRQLYFEERTKELLQYAVVSHSIKFISAGCFAVFDVLDETALYPFTLTNELSYMHLKKFKDEYYIFNIMNSRNSAKDGAIMDSLISGKNFPSAIFDGGKSPIGRFLYQSLPESKIIEMGKILLENSFFSEPEINTKQDLARSYIAKFKEVMGEDVFEVVLNALQGIYGQINANEKIKLIKSYKSFD